MDKKQKPNTTEYKNAFRDANYDQVAIAIPKGERQVWKEYAKSKGQSLSFVIVEAMKEKMERDASSEK